MDKSRKIYILIPVKLLELQGEDDVFNEFLSIDRNISNSNIHYQFSKPKTLVLFAQIFCPVRHT